MNLVHAAGAYPLGKLADSVGHNTLLATGLVLLIAADALLAPGNSGWVFWAGVALWGLHMATTQGLRAAMVAKVAPADLRGTAYGVFNLVCGVSMLIASALAGLLWDRLGATSTFLAGLLFATLALLGPMFRTHRGNARAAVRGGGSDQLLGHQDPQARLCGQRRFQQMVGDALGRDHPVARWQQRPQPLRDLHADLFGRP